MCASPCDTGVRDTMVYLAAVTDNYDQLVKPSKDGEAHGAAA